MIARIRVPSRSLLSAAFDGSSILSIIVLRVARIVVRFARGGSRFARRAMLLRRSLCLVVVAGVGCAHTSAPPGTGVTVSNAVAVVGGTPTAPPPTAPLTLIPSNVARSTLVAFFVVRSLDRSLETAVALVRKASPLPIDAAGARDLLLAQIGLPSEISRHLDLRAPVAGAAVTGHPGAAPVMAFSLTAKSAEDLAAVLAAAGTVIARRGTALQIQARSGEKGWFMPIGNVLLIADAEEALTSAGALALDGGARRAGPDDVSVVVYPEALARAMGTTVPAELERLQSAWMGQKTRASGGADGMEATGSGGGETAPQLREIGSYVADAASIEFAVDLDVARGLALLVRLAPRSGTRLETVSREIRVAMPDASIGAGNENPGALILSSYNQRNLEPLRRIRALLAARTGEKDPKSARDSLAATRFLDGLLGGLTGDFSAALRVRPLFSGEAVYGVTSNGGSGALRAALSKLDPATVASLMRAGAAVGHDGGNLGVKLVSVGPETFGKSRGVHLRLAVVAPPERKKVASKLFGPKGIDAFAAVIPGDRFAVTFGGEARARMVTMAAGAPAARAIALSEALGAGGARSIFGFLDLRDAIRFALALGQDSRERAVGDSLSAPMPVFGGVTGDATGKQLTLDLTVPPTCFAGMGGLLQAALTMRQ